MQLSRTLTGSTTVTTDIVTLTSEQAASPITRITLLPSASSTNSPATASQTKSPLQRRLRWAEDTIDNEHLDKKKSKSNVVYFYCFYF